MHEGFDIAVRRRASENEARLEMSCRFEKTVSSLANPTDFEKFASPDFSRVSLIIDRLKRHNIALERLLRGLDCDLRAPSPSSYGSANGLGHD